MYLGAEFSTFLLQYLYITVNHSLWAWIQKADEIMLGASYYQLKLFDAIPVLLQCCSKVIQTKFLKYIREFMQKLNEPSANIHDKKQNSTSVFSWHTCKLAGVSFRRLCLSNLLDAPLP